MYRRLRDLALVHLAIVQVLQRKKKASCSRILVAVGVVASVVGLASPLAAEFVNTDVIALSDQAHGIAFDGSVWHIARPVSVPGLWNNYDDNFAFVDSVILDGTSDTRGLTYDNATGTLFVSDVSDDRVYEYSLDGTELHQFGTSAGFANALALDVNDNTLWIAYFSGLVERRSRTGVLIDSFTTGPGLEWTGLAIDLISDTLLLLETDDRLYEFAKDGTLIGQLLDEDEVTDNGQGLYYDSTRARLYATGQAGFVSVFQDPSRHPIFLDDFESGDTSAWSKTQP